MSLPSYETLETDRSGAVATLLMNRPQQRNALSPQLDADLRAAFNALSEDESVRCIVLRGAGGSFCAGADLTVLKGQPTPEEMYDHLTTRYLPLVQAITTIDVPVLAGVEGTAAGAGLSLALACDLRVMAHDALLVTAFSSIGFVPDSGASYFLARQLGYSRAFEVAAESKPLPAERCEELGLTNRVVPADDLPDATAEWAAELAERPTFALGLTKRTLRHAQTHSLEEVVRYEAELQKSTLVSADHAEGLTAFLEKRTPEFEGT